MSADIGEIWCTADSAAKQSSVQKLTLKWFGEKKETALVLEVIHQSFELGWNQLYLLYLRLDAKR